MMNTHICIYIHIFDMIEHLLHYEMFASSHPAPSKLLNLLRLLFQLNAFATERIHEIVWGTNLHQWSYTEAATIQELLVCLLIFLYLSVSLTGLKENATINVDKLTKLRASLAFHQVSLINAQFPPRTQPSDPFFIHLHRQLITHLQSTLE